MNRDKAREILTRGSPATEPLLEERLTVPSNVEQPDLVVSPDATFVKIAF